VCCIGLTGVEPFYESRQVSPAGIGLTGAANRSDRCWSVDLSFGSKGKQEITDLESLDHAYVEAPNEIDEDRKVNLIKSIFKPWPPV
jgi:hypothetical protein